MAVSVKQFKEEFPEFNDTENAVIQSRLSMANLQVNSSVWGGKANDGIKWLAAHLIAVSPSGEQAKLTHNNRGTIYLEQFEMIKRQVVHGLRLI